MPYVDGFVIPVPKKNVEAYRRMAKKASKIWIEYGALQYFECAGDDLNARFGKPFPKAFKVKPNETVMFSWVVYKSRAARDAANKKIMKDPRMAEMPNPMPFDHKRMFYGGFKIIVEAKAKS